jgi:hypothetical protein
MKTLSIRILNNHSLVRNNIKCLSMDRSGQWIATINNDSLTKFLNDNCCRLNGSDLVDRVTGEVWGQIID